MNARDNELFRAGQLDQLFRARALNAGRPYTTAPLLEFSRPHRITQLSLDNAAGRAAAYLSPEESAEWKGIMQSLVGKDITEQDRADYALGIIANYAVEA